MRITSRRGLPLLDFNPRHIGGLALYLSGDRSPRTMGQGMAADFELDTAESLSRTDSAALSGGAISLTLDVWVKLETKPAAFMTFMKKGVAGDNTREYQLGWDNVTDRFLFGVSVDGTGFTNVSADSLGAPSLATWYRVRGWLDNTANTINIQVNDGTIDSAAYTSDINNGNGGFALGAQFGGLFPFDGQMQCVSFLKRIYTAEENTAMYNGGVPPAYFQVPSSIRGDSTHCFWELNEPSGPRTDQGPNAQTLTDNNTVTTAAGTCLNAVEQWNDISGNGRHATQATQANKPVLRYVAGTGWVLRFDGVNDDMTTAAFSAALAQPYTIVVLLAYRTVADAKEAVDGLDGLEGNIALADDSGTVRYRLNAGGTGFFYGGAGAASTAFHVHVCEINGGASSGALDGSKTTGTVGSSTLTGLTLGHRGAGSNFADCDIKDVIVYNRALSDSERRKVERYLARPAGIVVA